MTMQFRQFRHLLIAALALAALSSLAAGCGGDSSGTGVANVGTTTSAADSSGGSSDGGSGKDSDGKNPAKFSACMRAHGVRNFPDPQSGGGINIGPNSGIDPNSPTFKAAEKACVKELDIQAPSPAEQAKMQEQALKYSQCMRAHGMPNFPDPQFSGNKAELRLNKSTFNPNSPQFKKAQKACENLLGGPRSDSDEKPGGLRSTGGGSGS
jgi:hypothetical protein